MGAPPGNQFWKLRSKHGRDKLFANSELMWEACCEYFQHCVDNPLHKSEAKTVNTGDFQSQVKIVQLPLLKAFTLEGLCLYLDCNTHYFSQFENGLDGKDDQESKDFSSVITRVRDVIYDQKFSGAAAGLLNANIIARDLGLRDKTETEVKIKQIPKIEYEMPPGLDE